MPRSRRYGLKSFSKFTATLNETTLSSTGDMAAQKQYTLTGLPGGGNPSLDLSSLDLGPADAQFVAAVLKSFNPFATALTSLNVMRNPIGDGSLAALMAAVSELNLSGNPAIGQEEFPKSVSIREEAATGIDITKGVYGTIGGWWAQVLLGWCPAGRGDKPCEHKGMPPPPPAAAAADDSDDY